MVIRIVGSSRVGHAATVTLSGKGGPLDCLLDVLNCLVGDKLNQCYMGLCIKNSLFQPHQPIDQFGVGEL